MDEKDINLSLESKENRREKIIRRMKDCGQYLIDNAETILGEEKYMKELYVTCSFFDRYARIICKLQFL